MSKMGQEFQRQQEARQLAYGLTQEEAKCIAQRLSYRGCSGCSSKLCREEFIMAIDLKLNAYILCRSFEKKDDVK